MKYLRWSETAADDLQRIAEHIRAYNSRLEHATIGFIVERADVLRKYPRIGIQKGPQTVLAGKEKRTLLAGKRYRLVCEVH
ncbi:type II toxin-antitoxin system RelE/ParE family toxin [Hymenobacter sp. IS2118]|uniref:type II toxin-antitoxin system RelE/ParE family toxin n=1 Tax=Hymenobacter sp. IS2118 TaxID=1505605 RepID=UPI0009075AA5|nr:type II toxin-antitoxin system RelE/ParE family toxin [Hymenobacter sp. IS2118]